MKQSVVTVDRIIDKIVHITTSIDDIQKLIAEISGRRTTIEHDIENVRVTIGFLSELENIEEVTNKIRDLELEMIIYREDRDKCTESLFRQQQYLEKQLYAKKLLESLLEADLVNITDYYPKEKEIRRPSPPFEPYPENITGISKEATYWGAESTCSEEEE